LKQVTIYTTEPCSFCRNAKALLSARGVEYTEVNLSKDPAGRTELAQRTGMLSFPQILVDDAPLGGFRELLEADRDGTLDHLLAA
jgi:glutaredoxin 3